MKMNIVPMFNNPHYLQKKDRKYVPYVGALSSDSHFPAPVISNEQQGLITSTEATFTWTTNIPANTIMHWGIGGDEHQFAKVDENLVLNHSITITGLTPSTEYFYQAHSKGYLTKIATGLDNTFITQP